MFTRTRQAFPTLLLSLILFPTNAFSEEGVIEEVLVTATLKVQRAQDTPISMTVIGGDALLEKDLMQLSDIALQTPALHISEGTVSNKLFLRGVGSGQDSGIEQSVGTVIDGVYQGRSKATTAALFDIERVEVLKGPQTTYFGNNTIGGALSIITNTPGDTAERSISGTFAGHGESTIQAILSGPFTDGLKGRLAIQLHSIDGWLKNINPIGEDHPKKDSLTARATLLWDSWDDMDVSGKAEIGRIDNGSGIGWQQIECPPDPARFPGGSAVGPFNMCRHAQELVPGFEAEFDDRYSGSENQDGYYDTKSFVLRINKTFGNQEFTSITSRTAFDVDQVGESDESQLPFLHWSVLENSGQFAQEARLSGAPTEELEYTLGAYVQRTDVDLKVRLGLFNLSTGNSIVGFSRNFKQDTNLMSVFGSITYAISETVNITPSFRWTDVEKDLNRHVLSAGGSLTFDDFNFDGFTGLSPVLNRDDSANDSATTPALNLQYFPREDSMFYASYSDGFKAGGFEAIPNTNEGGGAFDAESVGAFEIGYKTTVDRLQLSLALFRNEYKDLQTAAYRVPQNPEEFGTTGFWSTTNVNGADVQGLDVEMAALITDAIRLDASVSILDATFRDFENGFCPIGSATLTCDKTGTPLPYAPDKSGLITLSYDDEISNGLNFSSFVSFYFSDGYFHEIDQDPHSWEPSYHKIDARIEIYPDDERWYLALVGKNLNDEYTSNWRTDVFGTPGGFLAILDRTRSVGIQFGYNF